VIELYDDPHAFLAVAEEHLRADPVVATVVSTATLQDVHDRAAGVPLPEGRQRWWAVARDGAGQVVGCGLRTPTPFPPYLLPMPDEDAVELARILHERGEDVRGVAGTMQSAQTFAAAWTGLAGGEPRVLVASRLFALTDLVPPTEVPGALRVAADDDLDLVIEMLAGFQDDAEAQAGRDGSERSYDDPDRDAILRRVRAGHFWLWATDDGPISLVGSHEPAFGASRVGPVNTPPAHRGQGYAAAATAAVSARLLDAGVRPCLFTDLANPTSNGVYTRIGYRPVVDTCEMTFATRTDWAHGLA
jgi:predicted GNAT family acetyltransferase